MHFLQIRLDQLIHCFYYFLFSYTIFVTSTFQIYMHKSLIYITFTHTLALTHIFMHTHVHTCKRTQNTYILYFFGTGQLYHNVCFSTLSKDLDNSPNFFCTYRKILLLCKPHLLVFNVSVCCVSL